MTNNFTRKTDPAAALGRALAALSSRTPPQQQPIEDPFAAAIAQRLQDRGIAQVPGLPQPPEPDWIDKAIAFYSEVQPQTDEQPQTAPVPIVELIRATLAGTAGGPVTEPAPVATSAPAALNDINALLRGAINGAYTVNGQRPV